MGYYDDTRFNGGFEDFKENKALTGEGKDRRDAGLKFIVDTALSAGLNLTPQTIANLRNAVTLGNRGSNPPATLDEAMPAALRFARAAAPDTPFMFAFNNVPNLETPVLFRNQAGSDRLVLPVPPETFSVQAGNAQEEVTSVLGITYTHAGPVGLAEMSLEGILPFISQSTDHPTFVPEYVRTYGAHTPGDICSKFITAMNAGQPIEFTVSDPKNQTIVMNTKVVTVVDFQWEVRAGHGLDRFYTMTLREWVPQTIYFGGYQPGASFKATLPKAMTLGTIADKAFRPKFATQKDRNRFKEIYELNKVNIEKFAKGVRAGKINPNTNKPWAKNVAKSHRQAVANSYKKKITNSINFVLPSGFSVQLPVGADLKAISKKPGKK